MPAWLLTILSTIGYKAIKELFSALTQYFKAQRDLMKAKTEMKKKVKRILTENIPGDLSAREKALLRAKRINDLIHTM